MGARGGCLLGLVVLLGSCLLACAAAPLFPKFTDGDETHPFVLGFSSSTTAEPPSGPHRTLLMRSANGTRYRCFLPPAQGSPDAGSSDSSGDRTTGTSITTASQGSLAAQKKPTQLLEALAEHCYYQYEDWWSYEVCYGKHVRQYHKAGESVEAEYLLGVYDELEQPQDEDAIQVDTTDVSGGMRYVSQLYSGGDTCELTGEPRQAEVRFTCGVDGAGTRLASIQEPSSCRYIITISTPRLCKHAAFQEQPQAATPIRCHPLAEGVAGSGSSRGSDGPGAAGQCSAEAGTCGAGGGGDGDGMGGEAWETAGTEGSDGDEDEEALLSSVADGNGYGGEEEAEGETDEYLQTAEEEYDPYL